jgi:hypothetical protein
VFSLAAFPFLTEPDSDRPGEDSLDPLGLASQPTTVPI